MYQPIPQGNTCSPNSYWEGYRRYATGMGTVRMDCKVLTYLVTQWNWAGRLSANKESWHLWWGHLNLSLTSFEGQNLSCLNLGEGHLPQRTKLGHCAILLHNYWQINYVMLLQCNSLTTESQTLGYMKQMCGILHWTSLWCFYSSKVPGEVTKKGQGLDRGMRK